MCATYPAYTSLINLIIPEIIGDCTSYGSPHYSDFPRLPYRLFLRSKILLSTLFSDTHNLHSTLNLIAQVS
jgi:hypothetical protein